MIKYYLSPSLLLPLSIDNLELTNVASASNPFWRTRTAECISIVIARSTVATSICITLVLTYMFTIKTIKNNQVQANGN